jgi:hypothetical protein
MGESLDAFTGATQPVNKVEESTTRFVAAEEVTSRFRLTELLVDEGRLRYGLWDPPEIRLLGGEPTFTVPPEMEQRPDLIANQFYGDVELWWAIMWVNNILLPIRDLVAGMTIVIPSKDEVDRALIRARK